MQTEKMSSPFYMSQCCKANKAPYISMIIMSTLNPSVLKNDCFGGLTETVVALPLALAFGVQSGTGAVAGLYGAIALVLSQPGLWRNSNANQRLNRTNNSGLSGYYIFD